MQNNKKQIQTLKDNSELAWAAYGYFHLANESYKPEENSKDLKRLKYFRDIKEDTTQSVFPTLIDILNIEYKYFKDEKTGKLKDGFFDDELFSGEFSPPQAKQFFSRYDLLKHCLNTDSGFSATLFQNKETKEYTLAIRGTEFNSNQAWQDVITTDGSLFLGSTPLRQYNDMLSFYNQCKAKYPEIKAPKSLTLTGHFLGGCLTQLFVLSICDDKSEAKINEICI